MSERVNPPPVFCLAPEVRGHGGHLTTQTELVSNVQLWVYTAPG